MFKLGQRCYEWSEMTTHRRSYVCLFLAMDCLLMVWIKPFITNLGTCMTCRRDELTCLQSTLNANTAHSLGDWIASALLQLVCLWVLRVLHNRSSFWATQEGMGLQFRWVHLKMLHHTKKCQVSRQSTGVPVMAGSAPLEFNQHISPSLPSFLITSKPQRMNWLQQNLWTMSSSLKTA